MAKLFTPNDWKKINDELTGNEAKYGLPRRDNKSLVVASWNIRKFGKIHSKRRDSHHFEFITKVAKSFDLISVQDSDG